LTLPGKLRIPDEYNAAPYTCVMHCFSSGPALAEAALDLGFYLSMSGIAAFPKSQSLRDIFKAAPLDRIRKRNEPAFVADTALVGAEVFDLDYPTFAARIEANFDRLFAKVSAWQS